MINLRWCLLFGVRHASVGPRRLLMEGISVVRSSSSYVFVLICKATMLISLSDCLHPVVAEQVQLDFCKECSSSWNDTSLHNHRLPGNSGTREAGELCVI